MAKNDHDYPATRILANGHTLVIASEGNNRIGMVYSNYHFFEGCLILRLEYFYGEERVMEIVRYASPLPDPQSVFPMRMPTHEA
jgi:hypothetical protein